jgi:adenylosuccinate synthase
MKLVVIGAQWGDEGKGKIVDYLAGDAQIIVRFSGGANAGHTIVIGDQRYALHLVPSGILYPDKTVVLGAGMVIDPKALFDELAMLEGRGIDWKGRVLISDRAHIVLPRYIDIDRERDAARKKPIGTTGRGIGITYSMKSDRDGIRMADLLWKEKMDELDARDLGFLEPYRERLLGMSCDLAAYLVHHKRAQVLFEGAQGALLDLDMGTYPYVSSGTSCAAGAAIGGCVGPRALDKVLGVFKAYSTRVGNGSKPTWPSPRAATLIESLPRDSDDSRGRADAGTNPYLETVRDSAICRWVTSPRTYACSTWVRTEVISVYASRGVEVVPGAFRRARLAFSCWRL